MSLFLNGDESLIYGLILGHGSANPLPLADICARTRFSPRAVKAAVESLRVEHRLAIGARRGKPHGYYIAKTPDELEASARLLFNQGFKMLKAGRRLVGKTRMLELMKQQRLFA